MTSPFRPDRLGLVDHRELWAQNKKAQAMGARVVVFPTRSQARRARVNINTKVGRGLYIVARGRSPEGVYSTGRWYLRNLDTNDLLMGETQ